MKTLYSATQKDLLKGLILSVALISITISSRAQVCSSPTTTIYSLSNAGGIYPVTVSNASVGSIVNSTSYGTSTSANSIGYNTNNGLFYYFQVALSGTKEFVSYDPTTNIYTTLAPSSISATVNRGCVNFDGTGYYCLDVNGNLYYYNISSNTWTFICSTFKDQNNNNVTATFSSEGSGDMAVDGLGNLWIVCSNGSNWGLYKLSAPLPTTSTSSITLKELVAPTTATPTGTAGFVGIAFSSTGNIYMATGTDLYVLQPDYTLTHSGTFSQTGICGDLTSCSYPASVLPVSFENFTLKLQENNSVSVAWEVAQQTNNSGYYVERSADGTNWNKLSFIPAGNGNSQLTVNYNYTDFSPNSGNNYYRICEVDLDGKQSYSDIKTVSVANNNSNMLKVWPNPAKDLIQVQNNNASYTVARIYNQSGAMVSENKLIAGINTLNVSSLSFGAYIISVKSANGESFIQKFIKE